MTFDAETLTKIEDMAVKAMRPTIQEFPGIGKMLVAGKDGHEWIDLPATNEHFRSDDLDSFIDYVRDNKTDESAVFVNGEGVFFRQKNSLASKSASLPLNETIEFVTATRSLTTPQAPASLVRMLRRDLYHCLEDPAFLNALRKIDFTRKSNGSSSVEHGRESLGRSVEDRVQSQGNDLAEEVKLQLRRYRNPEFGFTGSISYVVNFDYDAQKLILEPRSNSLEEYQNRSSDSILEVVSARIGHLIGEDFPVYSGKQSTQAVKAMG